MGDWACLGLLFFPLGKKYVFRSEGEVCNYWKMFEWAYILPVYGKLLDFHFKITQIF